MKYKEAVRKLIKAGIPHRMGGGDHYVFYPPQGGMVVVPYIGRECTKQMRMVVEKCLNGTKQSRSGLNQSS